MRFRAILGILVFAATVRPAADDRPPAALFTAALAQERALRAPSTHGPSLQELRTAIAAYEAIQRRFPATAFGDRALWQASGLAFDAFERHHDALDLETGTRLLGQLASAYPESPLAARATDRRHRFDALRQLAWLTDVRRETIGDLVRVTLEVDREVEYRTDIVRSPPQVFFDLHDTSSAPGRRNETMRFDGQPVREIRLERRPGNVTRVLLDTADVADCDVLSLYDPFRLIADCRHVAPIPRPQVTPPLAARSATPPAGRAAPHGGAGSPDSPEADGRTATPTGQDRTPTATPTGQDRTVSLSRQLGLGISRIVIDAGHGGYDPGASARDLSEADVVLDIAQRLARRLPRHGIEVVLTRRRDEYMPLAARTELANRVDADLFLSIHANASRRAAARGVETYVLDFATDAESEAVAARENARTTRTLTELPELVRAIATGVKAQESERFAELVQQGLIGKLRAVDPDLPDLGVKRAPFAVLIGARMPSVLAEVSFLTNRHDARFLATDSYRDLIADALLEAVLRYRRTLTMPLPQNVSIAGGS